MIRRLVVAIFLTTLLAMGGSVMAETPRVLPSPLPVPVHAASLAKPWSIITVGDIMLDRNVRASIVANGKLFPFAKITSSLSGQADIVLANLEGPMTNNKSVTKTSNMTFTFDPAIAPILKQVGFSILSQANNHTLNFGQAGLDNTRAVLKNAGLSTFGDPSNRRGFTKIVTVEGQKIGFVGYVGLWDTSGLANTLAEIRTLRPKVKTLIVVPHWGVEYKLGIQPALVTVAHQFINAGADMVIGGHPHVVEPVEVYKGKFIAYSLGNFLFDQYFSTDTLQGLMLKLQVSGTKTTITFTPVMTVKKQVTLLTGAARTTLLKRIATGSTVTAAQKAAIVKGVLTLP